jgi:hypothetical protein
MEQELLSKKELLETTGISYGQLYRWKRKNLIPEEWFIRKSTFTGQETFFPREQILARVKKIIDMKEDLELNDIADKFSPEITDLNISKAGIIERNIVSTQTLELYYEGLSIPEEYSFEKILYLYIFDKMLNSGEISREECKLLAKTLESNFEAHRNKNSEVIFIRKLGISVILLLLSGNEIRFDEGVKIISRLSISNCIEELKLKII